MVGSGDGVGGIAGIAHSEAVGLGVHGEGFHNKGEGGGRLLFGGMREESWV